MQIAQGVFGERFGDFLAELTRRLKLSSKMQLMVALSLAESCPDSAKDDCKYSFNSRNFSDSDQLELGYSLLKQKLVEYQ